MATDDDTPPLYKVLNEDSKSRVLTTGQLVSQQQRQIISTIQKSNEDDKHLERMPVWRRRPHLGDVANVCVVVPYRFLFDENYFTLNGKQDRPKRDVHGNGKKGDTKSHRVSDFYLPCLGGCRERVHVRPADYDHRSDYLMCSDTCSEPIAAHKECLRECLVQSWTAKYVCACENCNGEVRMSGNFRLGITEIPYTILALLRFVIKHFWIMPMLFYIGLTMLMFVGIWMDYLNDLRDRPNANPFKQDYAIFSASDPDFEWSPDTISQKWFGGFTFYLLCAFMWNLGLGCICKKIWGGVRRLLWRFSA